MIEGLVIKNTGSWYIVKSDDGKCTPCKVRGKFRLQGIRSTSPVVVGDRVGFEWSDDETGLITKLEDRKNYIIRKSSNLSKHSHILAANIDLCFLIVTISHPVTRTTFIDRFLASAEAYCVPVHLIFNKIDIYTEEEKEYMDYLAMTYEFIGYPTSKISVLEDIGIDKLRETIKDKVTLFTGHSGVGKSTLINSLVPGVELKTGNISDYHEMGVHTTTFSEMIELEQRGYIIDTPGIKGFGVVDMEKEEISHYFREIFKLSKNCRFNNCLHINEPGCAVLDALEKCHIADTRYNSYRSMMDEDVEEKYR